MCSTELPHLGSVTCFLHDQTWTVGLESLTVPCHLSGAQWLVAHSILLSSYHIALILRFTITCLEKVTYFVMLNVHFNCKVCPGF